MPGTQESKLKTNSRKNSDDDYFVEETLLFTFAGSSISTDLSENDSGFSPVKKTTPVSSPTSLASFEDLLESVQFLKSKLLIETHHCCKFDQEDSDDEIDSDNEEIIERDEKVIKLMRANQYPDAEIDKLLETFKLTGSFKNDILNGEFIENDIRLSEAIREAIEEIKFVQRPNTSKSAELEKKKFLEKYFTTAELLGVSLTVEHLLPALVDLVRSLIIKGISSNKIILKSEAKVLLSQFLTSQIN